MTMPVGSAVAVGRGGGRRARQTKGRRRNGGGRILPPLFGGGSRLPSSSPAVMMVVFAAIYAAGAFVVLRWTAPEQSASDLAARTTFGASPVPPKARSIADSERMLISRPRQRPVVSERKAGGVRGQADGGASGGGDTAAARVVRRRPRNTSKKRRQQQQRIQSPATTTSSYAYPRVACLDDDRFRRSSHKSKRRTVQVNPELQRPTKSELDSVERAPHVKQPDQSACVPAEPWQLTFHPTCNAFHEIDVPTSVGVAAGEESGKIKGEGGTGDDGYDDEDDDERGIGGDADAASTMEGRWARAARAGFWTSSARLLGLGGWRGVWRLGRKLVGDDAAGSGYMDTEEEGGGKEEEVLALKMLKWDVEFDAPTYRRHLVDAVASDRLTATGVVTDIYGYCGHSVVNEFAETSLMKQIKALNRIDSAEGFSLNTTSSSSSSRRGNNGTSTVRSGLRGWPTLRQRVQHGRDAAYALSEMRSVDWHGGSSYNVTIVHKDIKPDNFLLLPPNGRLKLNDFNDAELTMFNATSGGPCFFRRPRHDANYQSPEEAWEIPLSHAVDLHALGGVLHYVLVGRRPYWDLDEAHAYAYLSLGIYPLLPRRLENSTDAVVGEVLRLARQCRSMNPADRPSASEVVAKLDELLESGSLPKTQLLRG